MKVLLKRFYLNGNTIGFHPQTQKLELQSSNNLRLWSAGDNDRRSKYFCSNNTVDMMTNIRQISPVPAMNNFCLYLKISVLSFINKALKIQPSINWGLCSVNCIYHLVNVLFRATILRAPLPNPHLPEFWYLLPYLTLLMFNLLTLPLLLSRFSVSVHPQYMLWDFAIIVWVHLVKNRNNMRMA